MILLKCLFSLGTLLFLKKVFATDPLDALLRSVAGVYKTLNSVELKRSLEKTVFVTAVNFGYLNHLYNFKCFADRLNLNFLVFAMEPQAYYYLRNYTTIPSYLFSSGTHGHSVGTSTGFRDKHFNIITAKKLEAVLRVMTLGYDVIFSDLDVAILQDPIPHLVRSGIDCVHSVNTGCDALVILSVFNAYF
jgi:hypothetical protein